MSTEKYKQIRKKEVTCPCGRGKIVYIKYVETTDHASSSMNCVLERVAIRCPECDKKYHVLRNDGRWFLQKTYKTKLTPEPSDTFAQRTVKNYTRHELIGIYTQFKEEKGRNIPIGSNLDDFLLRYNSMIGNPGDTDAVLQVLKNIILKYDSYSVTKEQINAINAQMKPFEIVFPEGDVSFQESSG